MVIILLNFYNVKWCIFLNLIIKVKLVISFKEKQKAEGSVASRGENFINF